MLHLRHAFRTRPHFVAFWVNQLPAPAPWIARNLFGLPLLTWTVRTRGATRTRGALRRPDHFRRLRAGNLMRAACP